MPEQTMGSEAHQEFYLAHAGQSTTRLVRDYEGPDDSPNLFTIPVSRYVHPDQMICWPVNPRIGNVRDNDPSLMDRPPRSADQRQDHKKRRKRDPTPRR